MSKLFSYMLPSSLCAQLHVFPLCFRHEGNSLIQVTTRQTLYTAPLLSKVIPVTTQAQVLLNLFLLLLFLSFKSLDSNALERSITSLACFPQKWAYNPPDQSEDSLSSQSDGVRASTDQVITVRPPPTFYSNNQQSILLSSEIGREKRMESATTRDCSWCRLETNSLKTEPIPLERKSEHRWLCGPLGSVAHKQVCPLSSLTVWAPEYTLLLKLAGAAWCHQGCKLKESKGD